MSNITWFMMAGFVCLMLGALGTHLLYEISWHELKDLCKRRQQRRLFDEIFDGFETTAIAMEALRAVGALILLFTVGFWLSRVSQHESGAATFWLVALSIVVGIVACIVWLPTAVARVWGADLLVRLWGIFRLARIVMTPLAAGAVAMETIFRRLSNRTVVPPRGSFEDEIMSMVTEGMHDGHLLEDAREMIEGVIELPDRDVADIMTARSDIDALDVDLPWSDVLNFVARCGRTRIPVYENHLDHVIGVLYVKDLLAEMARGDQLARRPLRSLLRKAWTVPKSLKLDKLLARFLKTRSHLAVVTDEHRSLAGIVTIEDVLEEIVGEIVDESDDEEVGEIHRVDAQTFEIIGRAHVADINHALDIELPEPDEFDTIAGLVIKQLGRIPQVGESIQMGPHRITVVSATPRKVDRVKLQIVLDSLPAEQPEASSVESVER